MRGKVAVVLVSLFSVRITPAYAGKSCQYLYFTPLSEDHPRLCGEKHKPDLFRTDRKGSPPPMRGKVYIASRTVRPWRITPAYAGKRPHGGFFCKSLEDHPRLCGEKQNDKNAKANTTGSPPPMRGKGISNLQKEIQRRITPAYAGKSNLVPDFHEIE